MAYFSNNKLPWILVGILIVINAFTLGSFWFGHRPPPPPPPHHEGGKLLHEELGLSDDQNKTFKKLRDEHFPRIEKINVELSEAMDNYFGQLKNGQADSTIAQQSLEKIGQLHQEIETEKLDHFSRLRAICTPEQQQKFDEIIVGMLGNMRPPPPGRDRPPHR